MASFDTACLGHRAGLLAADYANLRDLDRAGWAWEWLRRNPEFTAFEAVNEPILSAPRALVLEPVEALERQLLRWGLLYG